MAPAGMLTAVIFSLFLKLNPLPIPAAAGIAQVVARLLL